MKTLHSGEDISEKVISVTLDDYPVNEQNQNGKNDEPQKGQLFQPNKDLFLILGLRFFIDFP